MKKWLLYFANTLLFSYVSYSQNLVPNPSFEDYYMTFCGIMVSSDFEQTTKDWQNPTSASPSIYFTTINSTCYNFQPDSQYGGPIGLKGTQSPRTGEVMAGIWVYTIDGLNQRQYLQVPLNVPMVSGKTYIVSFYASLGDFIEKSINNLGVYFSENPISASGDGPLNFTPQVLESDYIENTAEWVLVTDTIVAEGDFNYMTIGNFYNDASSNTIGNPGSSGQPGTYGAYYFIDDVSVVETTITATNDLVENDFEIFPNPVSDEINIRFAENGKVDLIQIFNLQGIEIIRRRIENEVSSKIDCSDLPAGAYYIKLQSEQNSLTQKFIKL